MDPTPRITDIRSMATYDEVIKSTAVLNCYSDSCWPCKIISPAFANYSCDDDFKKIRFAKVNGGVLDPQLRAKLSELDISGTPTFLLFRDGKVVNKVIGPNRGELFSMLEEAAEKEDGRAAKSEAKRVDTVLATELGEMGGAVIQ